MVNKKVTELTETSSWEADDLIPVVTGMATETPVTKKMTKENFFAGIGGSDFAIYNVTNAQRLTGTRGDGTTPLVTGDHVRVTDQGNRIEKYLGNISADVAHMGFKVASGGTLSGGGSGSNLLAGRAFFQTSITLLNGKPQYVDGSVTWNVNWTGTKWRFVDVFFAGVAHFESTENVAFPWLVTTWTPVNNGLTVPVLTTKPTTNNFNWLVLRNSALFTISNTSAGTLSFSQEGSAIIALIPPSVTSTWLLTDARILVSSTSATALVLNVELGAGSVLSSWLMTNRSNPTARGYLTLPRLADREPGVTLYFTN